jgi:hypothetical protein
LTGTQRQKYEEKNGKRSGSGNLNLEKTLDSEAASSKPRQLKLEASDGKNAEELLDGILLGHEEDSHGVTKQSNATKNQSTTSNSSRREDYKELDVFERLNKTTTQAYAVKQHANIAEKMLEDILDDTEEHEEEPAKPEPHFERVDEYIQQNVFERLQKNTTRAYAGKQNSNLAEKKPDGLSYKRFSGSSQSEQGSPARSKVLKQHTVVASPSYGRSVASSTDVFERLQKTTTEAYAKKINPPIDHNLHNSGVLSGDERNPRSTAIETGSISNIADRLLDDMLDNSQPDLGSPKSKADKLQKTPFSAPISTRLRARRPLE